MNKKDNNDNLSQSGAQKNIYKMIFAVCIVVFLIAVFWIVKYFIDISKADAEIDNIKDSYVSELVPEKIDDSNMIGEDGSTSDDEVALEVGEEEIEPEFDVYSAFNVPLFDIDFESLQAEQNEDIYSWIRIPDTKVDYPILQHPEELDYYLDYNIDGTKGYPGCIYTQLLNSKDWSDNHTVLYGHNMKNGSMFANLHYFEDSEFFDAHPYIFIYTPDGVLVYEIFGAYEFSNAHLLLSFDVDDPDNYEYYLQNIYSIDGLNNHFRDYIELTRNDKIITLSTCISGKADKRYIVQGVLVASEKDGLIREDRVPLVFSSDESETNAVTTDVE